MLHFAIMDDNKKLLENMSKVLNTIFIKHDYDAVISYKTSNIDGLFSYLKHHKIDVFILDITLKSYMTGIEIAEKIREHNKDCYFIFITAYLEYGLIAYKCKTFDFLSKPLQEERLEESIINLFNDINNSTKKFIRLQNRNTIIAEDDIIYIERNGTKIVFHTNSREYSIYSSFNKLQEILPENFIRCHKSFIANINNITRIEPSSNTVYFNSCSCDIGPKYKKQFLEMINNYGFSK